MIEHPVMDYLRELNLVSLVVRYVLAMLCGGAIGFERERKQRPAGFRTHILVCVGAASAFIISQYLVERGLTTDISRLAAQVISGIGFLGAGTIIVTRHQQIKGLTTAAGLWASACMGLAIGVGFYEAAIIGTMLIILVASLMVKINRKTLDGNKYFRLFIEFETAHMIGVFIEEMRRRNIHIVDIEADKTPEESLSIVVVELEYPGKVHHSDIIADIKKMDGVVTVEQL
ncbi:MAG: MgtC/SapB family protein [Ruminococcaceae bacterium]|nr:MgtC/SapB family protein [Oscillospiraceae bacterium]